MNTNSTNQITRTIESQRKLETLLLDVMQIAVAQGLRFEVALVKARKRYLAGIEGGDDE